MAQMHNINVNGWGVEFQQHNGNGHLVVSVVDEEEKVMRDTALSKSKVRALIDYLESVEKEIVE